MPVGKVFLGAFAVASEEVGIVRISTARGIVAADMDTVIVAGSVVGWELQAETVLSVDSAASAASAWDAVA
jgi:hypothetical protein